MRPAQSILKCKFTEDALLGFWILKEIWKRLGLINLQIFYKINLYLHREVKKRGKSFVLK